MGRITEQPSTMMMKPPVSSLVASVSYPQLTIALIVGQKYQMKLNWKIVKVAGEGLELITGLLTTKQWVILLISLGLAVAVFLPIIIRS